MKATGIVRRVDDLGRIVIPKEIRRTLRIREGDPLEIYTEKDGGVIFRKYSPMGDLQEFAAQMCESMGSATGHIAAVAELQTIPSELLKMAFIQVPDHSLTSFPFALHLYNEPRRQSVSKKMKKEPCFFGS